MELAKYGRMRVNRCVRENFGYIGCGRDVLEHMDMLCSGRRMCNVRVLDDAFESIQPCHEDLKSFLTASYQCVTGKGLSCAYVTNRFFCKNTIKYKLNM